MITALSFFRHPRPMHLFRIILPVLFAVFGADAFGQSVTAPALRLSADRQRILLGEQFMLRLEYSYDTVAKPIQLPFLPDSLPHFESVGSLRSDTLQSGTRLTISKEGMFTSFDSGRWLIGPLVMRLGKTVLLSDTLLMDVGQQELNGSDYNDIRDIIEVAQQGTDWRWWLALGATILVLAWVIWRLRRRLPEVPRPSTQGVGSPYEQAMADLKKLESLNFPESGELKRFYSGLDTILRTYIDRSYGLNVLKGTTDEMLVRLKERTGREALGRLAEMLRMSDAAKFARYEPSQEDCRQSMVLTRQFIEELHKQGSRS